MGYDATARPLLRSHREWKGNPDGHGAAPRNGFARLRPACRNYPGLAKHRVKRSALVATGQKRCERVDQVALGLLARLSLRAHVEKRTR